MMDGYQSVSTVAIFTGDITGRFDISDAIHEAKAANGGFEFGRGYATDVPFFRERITTIPQRQKVDYFEVQQNGLFYGRCIIDIGGREYESAALVTGRDFGITLCKDLPA
jgi:hypothetical protein